MWHSFKKYFWYPALWWPSTCLVCLLGGSALPGSEKPCAISSPGSQHPSSARQWGRGRRKGAVTLDGLLGPLWLWPSAFLFLKFPTLPHLGPLAMTASGRAEMSRAVPIASLWVWEKPGDWTCWMVLGWLRDNPLNLGQSNFTLLLGPGGWILEQYFKQGFALPDTSSIFCFLFFLLFFS